VREYLSLLSTTADYCVLPVVDAYHLGYPEAAANGTRIPMPNALTFMSYTGYERGTVIKMTEVDIGGISFKNVEFVAFDILQPIGFDVILGQTLLREMRLSFDFRSRMLRMEASNSK
jgi:predicted aspartyl protease